MLLSMGRTGAKRRIFGGILYLITATGTAFSLANGLDAQYGWSNLMRIALAGSAAFALAALMCLLKTHYSIMVGLLAVCLAWVYFGPVVADVPWRSISSYVSIRYDLHDEVISIFFLFLATVYTVVQFLTHNKSLERAMTA